MLIDTHAHLTSNRFKGKIDELLFRAEQAGVNQVITIGCDLEDSKAAIELAQSHSLQIASTVGIHPCYVNEVTNPTWIDELKQLASSNPVAAIGEIGLDYYHSPPEGFDEKSWRAKQAEVFRAQLELATNLELPTVIHQRESGDDVLAILKDFPAVKAVLHCFTGTQAQADQALEMGHYLSFTGVVTYPKAPEVRELAAMVPADRFMVETDSPYLAPVPFRGKTNEPSYVRHTAKTIASERKISAEECANLSTTNARAFFKNLQ